MILALCVPGEKAGNETDHPFRSHASTEAPATLWPGAKARVIVSSFGFQKLLAINRKASPVLN